MTDQWNLIVNAAETGLLKLEDLSNIFVYIANKRDQENIIDNKKYYIYIRIYSLYKKQQSDCKNIKLSYKIIKFGITDNIDKRNISYGKDNGYFKYVITLPNKACAVFIENKLKQEFKNITVNNSFEYLNSKKLADYFQLLFFDINGKQSYVKDDYHLTSKNLYLKIISYLHHYYPEENINFGIINNINNNNKIDTKILSKNDYINYKNEIIMIIEQNLEDTKKQYNKLINFVKEQRPDILENHILENQFKTS